jgi:glycosyltransferase involved in cell wall biosynthesis
VNIGLLTTSFPRHAGDIAGDFVLGYARALRDEGHRVDVLAPEPSEASCALAENGIALHHVPYLRPRQLQHTFYGAGVPDNLRHNPLTGFGLAPFCGSLYWQTRRRSHAWHALVSHWAVPCALIAGAVRDARPHIAVLHSADVHLLRQLPMRGAIAERIARTANALWFVTQAQRDQFLALLPPTAKPPRTIVCPMGIDVSETRPVLGSEREAFRRRHRLQGFCVLLLTRLVAIKGVDIALRAAAMGGMTLLIAGDGPLRAQLVQQARALAVPVRWLGVVRGEEKRNWLNAADAFALPSRCLADGRSEGMPCALLEALAHGLPVAASRLDGIAEAFDENAPPHTLVPPEDPAALHAALLGLCDRPAASRDGSTRAGHYGWDRARKYMAELLGPVASAQPRSPHRQLR